METIKKKLTALKAEKETALDEVEKVKDELKEANVKCGLVSFCCLD